MSGAESLRSLLLAVVVIVQLGHVRVRRCRSVPAAWVEAVKL
ncbi:hypothetical protein [Streptomyces lydicus]